MSPVTVSTASSPSPMTTASTKSATGSGLNDACPPASTTGCVIARSAADSGMPGQVKRGQQVGVAEFGGEGDAEHVEGGHRAVRVDGELRDAVRPHELFQVGPDAVGALGEHARLLVQHLVEDGDALVGLADLVRVRVEQRPPDIGLIPHLNGGIHLTPDILHWLAHQRQQGLQLREDGLDRHESEDTHDPNECVRPRSVTGTPSSADRRRARRCPCRARSERPAPGTACHRPGRMIMNGLWRYHAIKPS